MKRIIKETFRRLRLEVTINTNNDNEKGFVSLKSDKGNRGNMLLSYIIEPFLLRKDEPVSNAHHHDWLSWQIGKTFLDMGYSIDVVHYTNKKFIPKKKYAFFVGARTNFQRISELLNEDCVKIVHLDTAHWIYNNRAGYNRYLDVQERRGVALRGHKLCEPNWAIECADYATTNLGNQFNVGTYQYAKTPIFQVPLPSCSVYPFPENKDVDACRNHFLWFGSKGLVHKGLDLVLEAFAEMPDYHLTVCGAIRVNGQLNNGCTLKAENDFEEAYYRELYKTPNIHTVGWVDIDSSKFLEIMNNCIGVIFPSCSEGGGASVITCMQAGLIPVVSYETNVEVGDFGVTLKNCSIEEIKNSVRTVSNLPVDKLKMMSRKAWKFVRENNTRERFAEDYKKIVTRIIADHKYMHLHEERWK